MHLQEGVYQQGVHCSHILLGELTPLPAPAPYPLALQAQALSLLAQQLAALQAPGAIQMGYLFYQCITLEVDQSILQQVDQSMVQQVFLTGVIAGPNKVG